MSWTALISAWKRKENYANFPFCVLRSSLCLYVLLVHLHCSVTIWVRMWRKSTVVVIACSQHGFVAFILTNTTFWGCNTFLAVPQWGTANAKFKTPSVRNPEVTNVPRFKAWLGSEYSHACFTHCQEQLPCLNFSISCPFTFISSEPSPCRLTALVWLAQVSVLASGIKIDLSDRCHNRLMCVCAHTHISSLNCCYWSFLYSAILHSRADSLLACGL